MKALQLEKRKFTIGVVAVLVVMIYLVRLLFLQVFSDDYKR